MLKFRESLILLAWIFKIGATLESLSPKSDFLVALTFNFNYIISIVLKRSKDYLLNELFFYVNLLNTHLPCDFARRLYKAE